MNRTLLRRLIKATAIRDMQGNWWKAFLLSLLETAVVFWIISYLPFRIPSDEEVIMAGSDITNIIPLLIPKEIDSKTLMSIGITTILYLFIMAPFGIGMNRYFLRVAKSEKATLRDVFSVYTDIRTVLSSICLTIITIIFVAISFVVFMAIPVGTLIISIKNEAAILSDFVNVLFYIFTLLFVIWISRYKFISYIYAEDGTGVFATLYKYFRYMKKKNTECLILGASYFGWMIMMFWMPYLLFVYQCLSSTVYAKYLYRFRGVLSFGQYEKMVNPQSSESDDEDEK